ncbi:MAG: translation elongation factor-like protein [Candidatus Sungbacteria bacterium]|uniref:Translation elongation factor-like protein n=1 Tax=Candidatus Sungiibacteriota bacterium TaxID=2750080 RepID=A0A931WNR3_9BACT|nr:translation elongation factor-like protein [Candidatus Sungbacteria bacterium]
METPIGKVTHYYGKLSVAVVALRQPLRLGDRVKVKDGDREWEQSIASLQLDHKPVEAARAGDEVAVKVEGKAREGALLLRVE